MAPVRYCCGPSLLANGPEALHTDYAARVERALGRALPQMEVRVRGLRLTSQIRTRPDETVGRHELPTIGNELARAARLGRGAAKAQKHILHDVDAVFRPGTMTLVLGQPGAGKSALLQVLSGRFPLSKTLRLEGEISYNGVSREAVGTRLAQFVSYTGQRDRHFPTLSVKETLAFAHACCGAELSPQDEEQFCQGSPAENKAALEAARQIYRHYPEIVTQQLGLTHCQDTIVGDAALRGVSGGERKRVTTGEMQFGDKFVTLMDEISTGLDSAATFDIVKTHRSLAQKLRKTVVMALLQPSPEVLALFDDVLILNDGYVMYHGPREQVVPYFESLGFVCPADRDVADFLIDIGTPRQAQYAKATCAYVQTPMTPVELAATFRSSPIHREHTQALHRRTPCAVLHPFEERLKATPEFHQPFWASTKTLVRRELRVTWRNKEYLLGRLAMLVVVGFLNATLFYNLDLKNLQSVLGTILSACLYFTLSQPALSPLLVAGRDIFYKQRDANFYRTSSYVVAVALNQIVLAIPDAVGFSCISYWMFGLVNDYAAFAVFVATVFLMSLSFSGWSFLFSALLPTAALVESIATLFALVFTLFAGLFITRVNIPVYFSWAYWLNPVAWALRSISVSQYRHEQFDVCEYDGIDYCARFNERMGTYSLRSFDIYPERIWIWLGMGFLLANFVLCFVAAGFVLERVRHDASAHGGVSSQHGDSADVGNDDGEDVDLSFDVTLDDEMVNATRIDVATPRAHRPVPVTLAFKDLRYSVPDPANPKQSLELLKGISGFANPGTITALMGSSGAGKTTLMDVIAGRKTGGEIRGQILLNGHEATLLSIRRSTGYCEQMDVHSESATFREALLFSAFLRQGADVPDVHKYATVDECLDLLNLRPVADKIIRGSSVEQKKRLTIGVELAAQPSVLFLDEPTSGLDAHAAKLIMDGVQKVADTGRTVVCTIHQPSWEVFQVFDSLLLLKRGGEMVYFGDIGENACEIVDYFAAAAEVSPPEVGYNPATWMLEVIGAGVESGGSDAKALAKKSVEFTHLFETSSKKALLEWSLSQYGVGRPAPGAAALAFQEKRAASNFVQLAWLLKRFFRMYWRSVEYNVTRIALGMMLAVIFGCAFGSTSFDTYKGVNTVVTMIGISSVFLGVVAFDSVMPFAIADRSAFYRERAAQTYNSLWYCVASSLTEIPYVFTMGFLFTAIFFPLARFTGAAHFLTYWLMLSLHLLVQTYIGQVIAFASPSVEVATTLGLLVTSISFMFMGFNPPSSLVPSGYKWLHTVVAPKYVLALLASTIFGNCDNGVELGCLRMEGLPPTLPPDMTTAQYLDSVFLVNADDFWPNLAVILAYIAVSRVLALLVMRFVKHETR